MTNNIHTLVAAKRLGVGFLLTAVLASSMPASAEGVLDEAVSDRPTPGAIILDAIIARPLGLVATAAGSALFVATLPFSILGGNVGEAADNLVKKPAATTFTRCLGCTAVQDQTKDK